jgi:CheY-like chemotaxis protein
MEPQRILVAEDDMDDREIILEAFKIVDPLVQVNFADNGEHVINILSQSFTTETIPCLIVLDLNMPRMNGAQTLKFLKLDPLLKHIPTIIYSTSINHLEKERCLNLGAHAYIIKPVSFKESLETARSFLFLCQV